MVNNNYGGTWEGVVNNNYYRGTWVGVVNNIEGLGWVWSII